MAINHSRTNGAEEVKLVDPVAIIVVPFPPQSHLNPLLDLSRLIAAYGIPIHFANISRVLSQAKVHVHGWKPPSLSNNTHFHELSAPPPIIPDKPLSRFKSLMNIREPLYDLARRLSETARRVVVIYDFMMTYVVQDIRFIPNAESYCFHISSAFASYVFFSPIMEGEPTEAKLALDEVRSFKESCFPPGDEVRKLIQDTPKFHSGYLYNSSRAIEGPFLHLLTKDQERLWAVGPVTASLNFAAKSSSINGSTTFRNKCLEWLDRQEARSVVYVSFGTMIVPSDEQIQELALGLEKSEQKFIWVLRDIDLGEGARRKIPLPDGYEERVVEGRQQGLIVRDWAPQLEILGHPSTGAFLSQCGWNSCTESMFYGVPMGTWPMQFEQPANAALIAKVLKIGIEVREWARRAQVLSSDEIGKAVRELMSSPETRRRAAELGEALKKCIVEGGTSHSEMSSFIVRITS